MQRLAGRSRRPGRDKRHGAAQVVLALAMTRRLPAIVAVLMAVLTAPFGGLLHELARNQMPSAFSNARCLSRCERRRPISPPYLAASAPQAVGVWPVWRWKKRLK